MKNKMKLLALLLTLIVLGACKKEFLEITPKGRLIAEKTADYDKLLNSTDLINFSLTKILVPIGDELIARDPLFSARGLQDQRLFRYEDNIYEPEQDPTEIATLTKILYMYNLVINEVMDSEEGTEAEKKSLKGEALVGRAWVYFYFTTLFTKPYNPTTATTDLGFALITEADVNKTPYKRATMQATYDLMVSDLTTAIPDLPTKMTSRFRATRQLAQALLGRVYLTMGKHAEALTVLDGAITNINANNGVIAKLYNYNVEMFPGGAFFSASMGTNGPAIVQGPNNLESIYLRQELNSYSSSGNSYFTLSPAVAVTYDSADLRRKFYNSTNLPYPAGTLRRLGPLFQASGFNIPEIYLMRAECRARTNKLYGAGSAEEDLLTLRRNRFPVGKEGIPAAMTQTQVVRFIIGERTRELAFTGMRWFDMRRLSVDPIFSADTYTHTLYMSDGTTQTFPLKPERLALKIPFRILSDNPGMQDNP